MKSRGKASATPVTDGASDDPMSVVDHDRAMVRLVFDRVHAHDAAEASARTLLARKVGVKKVKARRR